VRQTIPIRGRRPEPERFVPNPFILGLDLGQLHDWSVLSVLERDPPRWPEYDQTQRPIYHLVHLERVQTDYPTLANMVREIVSRPQMRPQWQSSPRHGTGGIDCRRSGLPTMGVDASGVGVPIVDDFLKAGIEATVVPITFTGGHQATPHLWADREPWDPLGVPAWRTPKIEIVGALQSCLTGGRLKIHEGVPYRDVLRSEMQDFRVTITAAANEVFEAKSGAFDDLVIGVAIALWLAWKLDTGASGPAPATSGPSPTRGYRGTARGRTR
jgi:hypothetical protein